MVLHALRNYPARAALFLILLAASALPAFSQENRFLVVFPSTITSGEYQGDLDLFAALFNDSAALAWTAEQPRAIATQRYREHAPASEAHYDGGTWLAYTIEHTDSSFGGDQDILLRRIDPLGQNVLGDSTSRVMVVAQSKYVERNPQIVASDGGLMIFYEIADPASGEVNVAALRVDEHGAPAWSAPVIVAGTARRERLVDAISNTRGGAIAIIETSSGSDSTLQMDIIAVQVDAGGRAGWGATTEPAVVAASRHIERNPAVVADGNGGAFVAYEIEYISGARRGDRDIFAQHLTPQGIREWVSETALPIVSSVPNAAETLPVIARDTGGIVIAFEMNFHSEKRPVRMIGVQRMDLTGRLTWNRGKKPELVSVPGRIVENTQIVSDLRGGIYTVVEARDTVSGDIDVYAQKFTSNGEQLWANGELPVAALKSDTRERNASAVPDGSGGLVVVASKEFITGEGITSRKIVAQRIASDGKPTWAHLGGPLLLSNTATMDDRPTVIAIR
jgi:hypothetical protein